MSLKFASYFYVTVFFLKGQLNFPCSLIWRTVFSKPPFLTDYAMLIRLITHRVSQKAGLVIKK